MFIYFTNKYYCLLSEWKWLFPSLSFFFFFCPFFLAFVDMNSRRTKWLEPFFCLKSFSFMRRLVSWPTFAFIYTCVIPAKGKGSYYHWNESNVWHERLTCFSDNLLIICELLWTFAWYSSLQLLWACPFFSFSFAIWYVHSWKKKLSGRCFSYKNTN